MSKLSRTVHHYISWEVDFRIDTSLHKLSIFKTIREIKTNYCYGNFRHPKLSNEN